MSEAEEIPLWEVFIRPRNGLAHRHCGSDKIYRHPSFYNIPDDVGHM